MCVCMTYFSNWVNAWFFSLSYRCSCNFICCCANSSFSKSFVSFSLISSVSCLLFSYFLQMRWRYVNIMYTYGCTNGNELTHANRKMCFREMLNDGNWHHTQPSVGSFVFHSFVSFAHVRLSFQPLSSHNFPLRHCNRNENCLKLLLWGIVRRWPNPNLPHFIHCFVFFGYSANQ